MAIRAASTSALFLVLAAATAAGAPTAPAAPPPSPPPAPPVSTAATVQAPPETQPVRADLSGVWVLNEDQSDDLEALKQMPGRPQSREGRPEGMEPGRMPGGRGGRIPGMGGGRPGDMDDMDDMTARAPGGRRGPLDAGHRPPTPESWRRLLIAHTEAQFEVENAAGQERRFDLGAGPAQDPAEARGVASRAYAEDVAVLVVTTRDGPPVRIVRYRLDPRTRQLLVTIAFLERGRELPEVRLVYDRR